MEAVLQDLWKIPTAVFLFFILMASASAQVVALGASNTRGWGVSEAQSYPAQLQALLQARGSSLRVTNEGVPGDTTGEMLARLASAVPDGTKIVILQFGTNDARLNTPRATRHANIAAILEELRKRGIRSVQVDELMDAALRDGLVHSVGIHLTAEGYRRVATQRCFFLLIKSDRGAGRSHAQRCPIQLRHGSCSQMRMQGWAVLF